ncbi:VOC family protein [Sphingomonas arenae]|uniref:VOC family protein n=1 Tax=Sphingomonas arenae TaxID=2812555 RepID=UPI00196701C0|nr:VOC family protein [Sphingomonas arenae]
METKQGDFVWYELMSPDTAASGAFYTGLLGWRVSDNPDYREIRASEGMVGGMLQLTPEMKAGGARPAWLGYIAVDDVDATLRRAEAAGGRTILPARDMVGVGRFAIVADPQGAALYVIRPTPREGMHDATSHAFAAERPMEGHCAWNELSSDDPAAAWRFYGDLFGWAKDGDLDMGPLGKYEFIRHGFMLGAIMPRMPQMPVSAWTFYFRVPDIDAAHDYARAHGATILMEPMEIPGGEYSLNILDPQGASVGLVGPRTQ